MIWVALGSFCRRLLHILIRGNGPERLPQPVRSFIVDSVRTMVTSASLLPGTAVILTTQGSEHKAGIRLSEH